MHEVNSTCFLFALGMILSFMQPLFTAQYYPEVPLFRPSFTKPAGGILVENCESFHKGEKYPYVVDIFPSDSLHKWKSCNDAYMVTWQHDVFQDISNLSPDLRWRLSTTMGFCPHMRCQLGNVSHSTGGGLCPSGLCFTKLEAGAPSFGACCFDQNGLFDSGNLIGVESKSQAVAKPIYKHSAVFLRQSLEDNYHICHKINSSIYNTSNSFDEEQPPLNESTQLIDQFFNANRMFDGSILVTQCPHTNILTDVPLFLRQEQVHLWIQLSPAPNQNLKGRYVNCHLLHTFMPILSKVEVEKCNDMKVRDIINRLEALVTDLLGLGYALVNQQDSSSELYHFEFDGLELFLLNNNSNISDDNDRNIHPVLYIWFHNWPDFSVPPAKYNTAIQAIVAQTSQYLFTGSSLNNIYYLKSNKRKLFDYGDVSFSRKNKAVVSCLSGRGRSGSLASLIAAQMIIFSEQHQKNNSNSINTVGNNKPDNIDYVTAENSNINRNNDSDITNKKPDYDGEFQWSHDLLVQLIIHLRSQRDGMVETPKQYRLVATLTGLADPGISVTEQ